MLPFLAVTLLLLPAAEAAGESPPCCGPREMKLRALLQGEQQLLALASTTMVGGRWRREEIELSLVQPTAISVLAALAAPVDQATVWEWNDDGTELGITVGQSQVDACTKSEGATVTMSANAFSDCIGMESN